MSVRSWIGGHSPGSKAWSSSPGQQGTDNTSSQANSQRGSWKTEMKSSAMISLSARKVRLWRGLVSKGSPQGQASPHRLYTLPQAIFGHQHTAPRHGRWVSLQSDPLFVRSWLPTGLTASNLCLLQPAHAQMLDSQWGRGHPQGGGTILENTKQHLSGLLDLT